MFWNVRQDNLKCSREESLLLWGLRVEPDVWKAGSSKMKGKGTFLRLMSFERPETNLKVGVYPVDVNWFGRSLPRSSKEQPGLPRLGSSCSDLG